VAPMVALSEEGEIAQPTELYTGDTYTLIVANFPKGTVIAQLMDDKRQPAGQPLVRHVGRGHGDKDER
jgi:hypothetical protein